MIALVLDTETTGLVSTHLLTLDKQSEIIEFCGILMDLKYNKTLKKYSTLIRPSHFPMSERTIKDTKTKLTNEMLEQAPSFKEVASKIKELIESVPTFIAHNAAFDMELINMEFERIDTLLRWPRAICTVEQTISMKGFRLTLTALHTELFGTEFDEAHRAEADTEALARIAVELYKRGYL